MSAISAASGNGSSAEHARPTFVFFLTAAEYKGQKHPNTVPHEGDNQQKNAQKKQKF
jgi:hypothetical protein